LIVGVVQVFGLDVWYDSVWVYCEVGYLLGELVFYRRMIGEQYFVYFVYLCGLSDVVYGRKLV